MSDDMSVRLDPYQVAPLRGGPRAAGVGPQAAVRWPHPPFS
ncbi:hypothetical protein [Streptomyces rishiriensis]|uniref:Uncharacterized protein n=1 Tax=Streptomyces rishiriensis TaxID=68264 RepID=A0ABU0NYL3_STRRH|nr:hypothetical protein [Streptomyces rishiriensis]MDQ0584240.1 hypothetical protein [Streptomyces rishiriensis]